MKFFGNKKTSKELSAAIETLGSLAGIQHQEATDEIKETLARNKELDPYAKKAGQASPFELALANGNIESLYAMYQHKPDPQYKPLLDNLAAEKLEKEIQKPSPSLEKIQSLLKMRDPSYVLPNKEESSKFQELFDSENIISLQEFYQDQPNPAYKYLLDTLASKKLLEEMQKPSPSIENIKFLLEAGADPTKENEDRQSALTIAKKLNKLELLHIMTPVSSSKAPFYVQNATQQALFDEVSKKADHDNIKFLIEKGADPFLKLPDTREANRILEEKVKEESPSEEELKALLKEHDENSKKAKEVSAFDILAENPVNLKSLHLMYQKLPKELEQDRLSYSKTLTDVVKHKLQQSLINQELNKRNRDDEFSFTQFNQIVAEAEKSKLPEVNEFAAELMAPHFTEAFKKDPEYTIDNYYQDNPVVLVFEDLSEELGKDKSVTLRESSSIEIASDEEFNEYMISNAVEIINQYADTTASNKYNFLKTENPNLNDQELLDKFVPKGMQQDIFHANNPNKVLEETVTKFVGQENIEQFKLATKIEILTEAQITKAVEQQNEALQVQKVESFLDRKPLLTNDSYYIQGPKLINFSLNNVSSNPQLLRKTIETIQEQNKNNPPIIEDMVRKIVTHSNDLESPAEALQIHSVLRETGVSLPNDYKLGQLSKEELEALQTLTTLTKDRERFLEGNCSAKEMKQLHNTISKLPLQKLPPNISDDIISLTEKSTQNYFDKEIETSQNIVRTIEDMVEVSKNSSLMLASYATKTPEILRNHLTHITANNIISAKEKSPTKLHKQKMAKHEKKFLSEQKELRAKADKLEQELEALPPVMQLSNLMTIDATKVSSPDQLELYSEKRKKDRSDKQAELLEATAKIDQLSNNYHAKKLELEEELNGKELSIEQKKYDKKLEQFHQFLSQKPNLKDAPSQSGDLLSSHVLNVAIENIEAHPQIMGQAVTLFKEQYSKEDLIIGLNDYRDQLLQDAPYKDQPEELKEYFEQLTDSIDKNYVVNSPDGNSLVIQNLANLDQYPELTDQLKQEIVTPSFPQISEKIRAKLRDKDTSPEQADLLTEILVKQLNESPPLHIVVLQKLHEEEKELTKRLSDKLPSDIKKLQKDLKEKQNEVTNLLRNAHPSDISHSILEANDDLATYIYDKAPKYIARNHSEVSKLVGIALKEKNEVLLHKIVTDILREAETAATQEDKQNKLLSVELLQSLHRENKLNKLFETGTSETLSTLRNQVVNTILESKQDIDPNLICDVIRNTQGVDNEKLAIIANIVLSDENKIAKLSRENIEILAPHYNSLKHNPLFLKELIDFHDIHKADPVKRIFSKEKTVTTADVTRIKEDIILSMTGGKEDSSLPKEFDKNLEKYLKTKRSVFKAFFRDQDAKITKRIGELDRGFNYFKAIMSEWENDPEQKKTLTQQFMSIFGFSKEKERTLTLDSLNKEDMHRVLKDAASQKEIAPDLATKIFHNAMQLGAYLDDSVKESIRKLAEIAYNNRETGNSPHITNHYITELSKISSDEFYQGVNAELESSRKDDDKYLTENDKTPTEEAQKEAKKAGVIDFMKKKCNATKFTNLRVNRDNHKENLGVNIYNNNRTNHRFL